MRRPVLLLLFCGALTLLVPVRAAIAQPKELKGENDALKRRLATIEAHLKLP